MSESASPGAEEIERRGAALVGRLRLQLELARRSLAVDDPVGHDRAGTPATITVDQGAALVEAKLGRAAQDALETSVVLEAWGGIRPGVALDLSAEILRQRRGSRSVGRNRPRRVTPSRISDQFSTLYGILLIAMWVPNFESAVGSDARRTIWQLALPAAIGIQWGLRRRLRLDDPGGIAAIGRLSVVALGAAGFVLGAAAWGATGVIGAALVSVWTVTTLLRTPRLLLFQTVLLCVAPIAIHQGFPFATVMAVVSSLALLTTVVELDEPDRGDRSRPAPWPTTAAAAAAGALFGLLIVLLPGVRDQADDPRVLLGFVPSLIGGVVGIARLQSIWLELPYALQGSYVTSGPARQARRVVAGVIASAIARYLVVSSLLSVAFLAVDPTGGRAGFYAQFVALGLVTMLAGLLDALRHSGWTLAVIAVPAAAVCITSGRAGAAVGLVFGLALAIAVIARKAREPAFLLAQPL